MHRITIGSLFDGSGGFPLAGCICGMEPLWASEIEPYPIAVTRARFPQMKHLGDVQKISGAEIDPVDIITFGSPCQDMSIAGKRAGLRHEENGDDHTTRSGLFIEAIRIIREMRQATYEKYPAFAVWENVPGAFSSNGGADFKTVLEELASVAQGERVCVPFPEKRRWLNAGEIVGDGFSIAWRVLDAQYWGVPQRRKRIYLVADFAGGRAGEILFEREGGSGNPEPSEEARQGAAADAENCSGAADRAGAGEGAGGELAAVTLEPGIAARKGSHIYDGVCGTLRADAGDNRMAVAYSFDSIASNSMKSKNPHSGCKAVEVAKTLDTTDPNPCKNQGGIAIVQAIHNIILDDQGGQQINVRTDGTGPTIRSETHGNLPCVVESKSVYCLQGNGIDRADTAGCNGAGWRENESYTLNTIDRPAVCYAIDCRNGSLNDELSGTLQAKTNGGYSLNYQNPVVYDGKRLESKRATNEMVAVCVGNGQLHNISMAEQMNTLDCMHDQQAVLVDGKPQRRYIVRRLTPLECCRLQGFPDGWGDIPLLEIMTDADAKFWEDVRRAYAGVMGKKYRPFKDRYALVKWYNKLHTDSAEYKMWGNGIALPCAVFVMQGIAECVSAME